MIRNWKHLVLSLLIIWILVACESVESQVQPPSVQDASPTALHIPTDTPEPIHTPQTTETPEPTATASPVTTATNTATPVPQVGETRLNPETGVEEVYDESRKWIEVAEEGELHIQGEGENAIFVEMMDGTWQEANPTLMQAAPEAKRIGTVDGRRWAYDAVGLRVAGFDEETNVWFEMDESNIENKNANVNSYLAGENQLDDEDPRLLKLNGELIGPEYYEHKQIPFSLRFKTLEGMKTFEFIEESVEGVCVVLGFDTDEMGLLRIWCGTEDVSGDRYVFVMTPGYLNHPGKSEFVSSGSYIRFTDENPPARTDRRSGARKSNTEFRNDVATAVGNLMFFHVGASRGIDLTQITESGGLDEATWREYAELLTEFQSNIDEIIARHDRQIVDPMINHPAYLGDATLSLLE